MRARWHAIVMGSVMATAVAGCDGRAGSRESVSGIAPSVSSPLASAIHLDEIGMAGGRGIFIARRDTGETRIAFDINRDRVAPERRHDMERVGETGDGVVVVIDRYATRAADPRCADGRESFVRVFSLPLRRQLMQEPLESCRDHLVVEEPAVTWLEGTGFRIEGKAPRTYGIQGNDTVISLGAGMRHG